ncbi:beta-lactamase-like protein [Lactarius indigo]|nr:beta-lactamase-like protein [Lactarius indigo]
MPTGTPFHGFIPPFPIRVDEFGPAPGSTAALHLLSHTHSDHILGLSAKSFASTIICSADAKEMLLRHEVYNERALKDLELRDEARLSRTFGHLRVPPLLRDGRFDYSGSRDLLRTLPLNTPTKIELSDKQTVTLTLFDANHCPGAVMFLVEGSQGAVLHTGDFRAEPWFLDDIRRNPFLQPYLAPPETPGSAVVGQRGSKYEGDPLFKTLDAIYLDNACLLSTTDVPTKSDATFGLVSLMALFPPETSFFINSWTWGYEDILRAIAHHFQSRIHVDRYKHSVYSHLADPFLRSLITLDASKTRFHACERFNRCSHASADDVVYINPVTIGKVKWEQYRLLTESKLRAAQPVTVLLVPLSRHSPLNELRAFVSLFRPTRVVPNTLDPSLHGLDALCIPNIFAGCLSNSQLPSASAFAEALADDDLEIREGGGDSALQNLVGNDAECTAHAWADLGRGAEKLAVVEQFLTGTTRHAVRRMLGLAPLPRDDNDGAERAVSMLQRIRDKQRIQACRGGQSSSAGESDQETESGDSDAHARTARLLFGLPGSSQSQEEEEGPATVPVSRVPTPPVWERGSQHTIARGNSRNVTHPDLSSSQESTDKDAGDARAVRFADSEPRHSSSPRLVAHATSPPSLTSSHPHAHPFGRGDPPLVNLKNIPLTQTKRQHPRSQSLSQSQSQSQSPPPVIHSHASNPTTKRRKLERLPTVPAHVDGAPTSMLASPRKQAVAARTEHFTAADLNIHHARKQGPDVDAENHKAHRRALRARSRVIEEKLRSALLVPT